jgi:hypothetical protein
MVALCVHTLPIHHFYGGGADLADLLVRPTPTAPRRGFHQARAVARRSCTCSPFFRGGPLSLKRAIRSHPPDPGAPRRAVFPKEHHLFGFHVPHKEVGRRLRLAMVAGPVSLRSLLGDGETQCSTVRSDKSRGRTKFAEPSSEWVMRFLHRLSRRRPTTLYLFLVCRLPRAQEVNGPPPLFPHQAGCEHRRAGRRQDPQP